jgi:hypothetical protein
MLSIRYTAAGKSRAAREVIVAAKRRRTPSGRRTIVPGFLTPRRGRRWSTYLVSAITLLVVLSMALPFCTRPLS